MDSRTLVDYAKSLDCIHCGLCLNTCPTYRLTGAEPSSPRGRIHLMRALHEGRIEADDEFRSEMDFCLLCRHCESVCPSGVRFGAMMEHTRGALEATSRRPLATRFARWVGFRLVLPHRFVLRAIATLGRLAQRTGLVALLARGLGARGVVLRDAPPIDALARRARLPRRTAAVGARRGGVVVLEGCVMPDLFPRVNHATVEVLAASGFECRVERDHVCCGSLHAHNGDVEGARALARKTIAQFERAGPEADGSDPIVVNSAGCSAHMKEYPQLFADDPDWAERARAFASRVKDFSEFLAAPSARAGFDEALARAVPLQDVDTVTYDDPCHLCHGQGIRRAPRELLAAIPTLRRVELDDSEACCGSAGIYSILRPADSAAVLAPKLDALRASRARVLVTANPGCQLQWTAGVRRAGLDVRVVHLAEILAEATRPAREARSARAERGEHGLERGH